MDLRLASLKEIAEELLRREQGESQPVVNDDAPKPRRGQRKGVEKREALR